MHFMNVLVTAVHFLCHTSMKLLEFQSSTFHNLWVLVLNLHVSCRWTTFPQNSQQECLPELYHTTSGVCFETFLFVLGELGLDFYRAQRSCEGYVFTPVCLSTGEVCLSACWDTNPPRAGTPLPGAGPLGTGTPQTRHPPGPGTPLPGIRHPPRTRHLSGPGTPRDQAPHQQTATVADGTHPTGMYSCLWKLLRKYRGDQVWAPCRTKMRVVLPHCRNFSSYKHFKIVECVEMYWHVLSKCSVLTGKNFWPPDLD